MACVPSEHGGAPLPNDNVAAECLIIWYYSLVQVFRSVLKSLERCRCRRLWSILEE